MNARWWALWVTSLALVVTCDNPTDQSEICLTPQTGAPPSGRGHPNRTGLVSRPLSGAPYGVAVSSSGAVYVTRSQASSAVRADLPSTELSAPFDAGASPTQVVFSPNGQIAYIVDFGGLSITMMDVTTNRWVSSIALPSGSGALAVGLTPGGDQLIALTAFGGMQVINTATGISGSIPADSIGEQLSSVAVHPFAPCVYVAARDEGTVRTVDLRTLRVVHTETIPGSRIHQLAISPDGAMLFGVDSKRSMLLSRSLTSKVTFQERLVGSGGDFNTLSVAVTPDGAEVYVSAALDGKVYVWDPTSLVLIDSIITAGRTRHIAFDRDGTVAVLPSDGGWVDFVSSTMPSTPCLAPPTGSPAAGSTHPSRTSMRVEPVTGSPSAVAISSLGTAYATFRDRGTAVRTDLPATTPSAQFAVGERPVQVRMSPNGSTAYVANEDAGTITFVDVATNSPAATASIPAGPIRNIGLSPDGSRLYVLTNSRGIYVLDTGTRLIIDSLSSASTGSTLSGVAFHPFAPCMYIAAQSEGVVRTVDLRDNAIVQTRRLPSAQIQNLAVSADGAVLYATDRFGSFLARNLASPTSVFTELPVPAGFTMPFDVAVTPDNMHVYVSTGAPSFLYVFDQASLALVDAIPTAGSGRHIAFSASGNVALVANESGWLDFVTSDPPIPSVCNSPQTGSVPPGVGHPALAVRDSVPYATRPFAVAVSAVGVVYVTELDHGTVARADLPATTLSTPFPVGFVPSQVRMSPDGQTAYVGNQDSRTITYVDVATNQTDGVVSIPTTSSVLTIGLSPDGTRLYALTDINGLYVVDVASRTVIDSLPGSQTGGLLTGVAFHPFSPCMYVSSRGIPSGVRTIDLTTNRVVHTIKVPDKTIQNVAVSRDGSRLYATEPSRNTLLTRDLTSSTSPFTEIAVAPPVRPGYDAFDVAVTPDDLYVLVSVISTGKVYILSRSTHQVVDSIVVGGAPRFIGFNTSGTHAIIPNEAGWVNFLH